MPLLVKYGFPLDFDRSVTLSHKLDNHKTAIDFPEHVEFYLKEKLQHDTLVGPFRELPLPNLHVSPFLTRDKSSSNKRRVIMDLSWPKRGGCQ